MSKRSKQLPEDHPLHDLEIPTQLAASVGLYPPHRSGDANQLKRERMTSSRLKIISTPHIHSFQSFRWAAMQHANLEQFISEVPYLNSTTICVAKEVVRPIPSDPLSHVIKLIDWDTITDTPIEDKLRKVKLIAQDTSPDQFNLRYHCLQVLSNSRYLWLAMVKGERIGSSPPSLACLVYVCRVDVTDLEDLNDSKSVARPPLDPYKP